MSVDNISHLGAQGLDELVPSRYALQVGDIEVLVISDGVLPISGETIAYNADTADLSAWLGDNFLPPEVLEWPLNVAVVRSGDQTVLIDAGLGMEFPDFPRAGQLALRLRAAGIDPAAVTDVVLTHMHMDHVGGLLGDGLRRHLSSDLRVHVAAAEAEFWESPDFSRTHMPQGVPDALRSASTQFLEEYRGQLRRFDTEYEVAPGVLARRTGGHTPRAQRGPPGLRRRPADVRRRRRVPGRVRPPRVVQRIRARPRGGGPGPGFAIAGAGGDRGSAGGHPPAVPVCLPRGGGRRRLPMRACGLGLLTARNGPGDQISGAISFS